MSSQGFRLSVMIVIALLQSGFVLLGSSGPKLDVSPESSVVTFTWDGKGIELKDLDKFDNGRLVGLSKEAVMEQLILFALEKWSEVPGSFVRLEMTRDPDIKADTTDDVFAINTIDVKNITTPAFALPRHEEGVILDCDISLSDWKFPAKELAYILIHELGHCLGLGHPHTNSGAIMGYSRETRNVLKLGADDIAGLIYLYPDPDYVSGEPNLCGQVGIRNGKHANPIFYILLLLPVLLCFFLWIIPSASKRHRY
jgi:hypothetical protein